MWSVSPLSRSDQTVSFHFPLELYGEIAQYLDDADKLHLCLTSKPISSFVLPLLYSTLSLQGSECLARVRFLVARPHLSRFIRELVLKLNDSVKPNTVTNEQELARAVELLAPNLSSLEKFVWDGSEIPEDFLWTTLRNCCPALRDIGTNIGTRPISPDSELFSFGDLRSFWLSTESSYHQTTTLQQSSIEGLPVNFWDMIIERSPRLESLTLGSRGVSLRSRRALDITPITGAKWPQLQYLSMEDCRLEESTEQGEPSANQSFNAFITSHQSLKRLHVHGLPDLGYRLSLKNLRSLGSPISLGAMPFAINTTITELILTDEPYNGLAFHALREYVSTLPSLKKLSVWMDLSTATAPDPFQRYDHIQELRSLVSRCPHLEFLKVVCSTKGKETFHLSAFQQVLQSTNLKSVELWKCRRGGDDTPAETAELLFRHHLPLENFTLLTLHGHRRTRADSLRVMHTGSYHVQRRAPDGKPEHIFTNEKHGKWLTWDREPQHDSNAKTAAGRHRIIRWLSNVVSTSH